MSKTLHANKETPTPLATGVAPAGRKRPRARRWTLEPSKKSVAWAKGQEERRQRKHTGARPKDHHGHSHKHSHGHGHRTITLHCEGQVKKPQENEI